MDVILSFCGGRRSAVLLILSARITTSFLLQSSESFVVLPSSSSSCSNTRFRFQQQTFGHDPRRIAYLDLGNTNHETNAGQRIVPLIDKHSTTTTTTRQGRITKLFSSKPSSSSSSSQRTTNEETTRSRPRKTNQRTWDANFQLLVAYQKTHGHCNVPYRYEADPILGRWTGTQRQQHKDSSLSDTRRSKLDALGFSWSKQNILNDKWNPMFQRLVEYKERHGNCNVPTTTTTTTTTTSRYKDDPALGRWVDTQRKRKLKAALPTERCTQLDAIGFSWSNEIQEERWEDMYQKLQQYADANHGDCNVPTSRSGEYHRLGEWLERQRCNRRSNLSEQRRSKLDQLGLIWNGADQEKANQKWKEHYQRLVEYKQNYGDCLVPQRCNTDPALGIWVSNQRRLYSKGQLNTDRQVTLENLAFVWKVREAMTTSAAAATARNGGNDYSVVLEQKWNHRYSTLLAYRQEHGHCNVPQNYTMDRSLGNWVAAQRRHQHNGMLRDDRKHQLEEIGFTWTFGRTKKIE